MKFPDRTKVVCRHGVETTVEFSSTWNADRSAMTVTATMTDCARCIEELARQAIAIPGCEAIVIPGGARKPR